MTPTKAEKERAHKVGFTPNQMPNYIPIKYPLLSNILVLIAAV